MLGDFNIDKRQGNSLFDAFVETGLWVPLPLQTVKTTAGKTAKHYDQIAWFQGEDFGLKPSGRAGSIDFAGAVYQELSTAQVSAHERPPAAVGGVHYRPQRGGDGEGAGGGCGWAGAVCGGVGLKGAPGRRASETGRRHLSSR